MKFETKFEFKQTVYTVIAERKKLWTDCGFCAGEGKIIGQDNSPRACPVCYGEKKLHDWTDLLYAVSPPMTIGEARVKSRCKHVAETDDTIFDNYGNQAALYEEEYMCYETGIGSGSVWKSDQLFVTEAEAQIDCDKRNALAEAKS